MTALDDTMPHRNDTGDGDDDAPSIGFLDLLIPLAEHKWLVLALPVVGAAIALGATYLQAPVFTAKTTLLPPRQQSSVSAVLGSLGGLANLAGSAAAKGPGDQHVAMLGSQTIADQLVDQFELMAVYDEEYRFRARKRLADNSKIGLDKKDGLIVIEVTDTSPERSADMANAYVERLRAMSGTLAVTEAQERRQFYERELTAARKGLARAQSELASSGISEATLRAEPRAAAEALSAARSELAVTEVQLRVAARTLADGTPEVQQLLAKAGALRAQLNRLEQRQPKDESNYIDKYRDFKYQEGLVEVFSKQYELARLDEQRDGAVIQIIDRASVPEWKSAPKRINIAVISGLVTAALVAAWLIGRHLWRLSLQDPAMASKATTLRATLRGDRR